MKKLARHRKIVVLLMVAGLLLAGCATPQKTGQALQTVAITAPTIAYQLDEVYKVLLAAKAVPDYTTQATLALASLDAIAPMVQAQGAALAGDQFNWASFVIQAAITLARVLGLWL